MEIDQCIFHWFLVHSLKLGFCFVGNRWHWPIALSRLSRLVLLLLKISFPICWLSPAWLFQKRIVCTVMGVCVVMSYVSYSNNYILDVRVYRWSSFRVFDFTLSEIELTMRSLVLDKRGAITFTIVLFSYLFFVLDYKYNTFLFLFWTCRESGKMASKSIEETSINSDSYGKLFWFTKCMQFIVPSCPHKNDVQ